MLAFVAGVAVGLPSSAKLSPEFRHDPHGISRRTGRLRFVDAGVIVELLANIVYPARRGDEELAPPDLIDSEVTHVLGRLVAHLSALGRDHVALAELALLTTDSRPANERGITCHVELL